MREQSNPTGTRGSVDWVIIVRFCCACGENAPKPTSARKTPARITNRPIKTRGLKKPNCEVDFFFIVEVHWSARFLIDTIRTINLFYLCRWTWQLLANVRNALSLCLTGAF